MYSVIKKGQVYYPSVSGNGKVIAWRDLPKPGVSEIGIHHEGEEPKLLTDDRMAVNNPQLNHDGSVVVFKRHGGRDWDWDIARLGPEDEDPVVVIDTPGNSTDFDVSSDGNTIVSDYWPREAPRIRHVDKWEKGQGVEQITPEGISSGLPQLAGDGDRTFYLRLPKTAREPNEIWMREADGSEKPVVYETGEYPEPVQKNSFDTNEDGSVLVWTERNSGNDAEVWRWDLENGIKERVSTGFLAGQATVSKDGTAMAWTETEKNAEGKWISELHWKQGDEEKIVSQDIFGNNTSPSLSADGKTLVWMWKHPKINFDHEIRKITFE